MKTKIYQKYVKLALIPIIILFQVVFISCQTQESFSFAFMTDIHVQPERHAAEGFHQAIEKVNDIGVDFVITGGDLIMDALGQNYGRADSLYDLYLQTTKDFEMPVYNTMGNHEVFGLYEKSGVDPSNEFYGKKMFLKKFNQENTYYSFDFKNWHFIILDGIGFTEDRRYYGAVDSLQIEWLKKDLEKISSETPIALSTHIPLISAGEQMLRGGTAQMGKAEVIGGSNKILELFKDKNLRIVLQGHLHIVEEIIYKNIHFITGGAVSAAWWTGPNLGFPEGFAVFDISGNDFNWHYQTYGWKAVKE